MTDSLMQVVYVSKNIIEGDDERLSREIEQILDYSRARNLQSGVTGALMFNRGLFAQVLEGPSAMVEETFERIQCDQRHKDVSLLLCESVTERSFDQWSMAYIGAQVELPSTLLEIGRQTGFDPRRIDGNAVHEALRVLLQDADDQVRTA